MGCWNKTCGLSGLPIMYGERAYVFVLEQNPDQTDRCYSTAFWKPLLLPFEADYNDYGGFENETGASIKYILEGLKHQMMEFELGDNEFHDIAVTKDGFDMEKFQEAVHESRMRVSSHRSKTEGTIVEFVMFRKDVVDHILENRVIEKYVGNGEGVCGYSNNYINYKFSDVIADVPAFIKAYKKQLDSKSFVSININRRMKKEDGTVNKVSGFLSGDNYRYSSIISPVELIADLISAGQFDDVEELVKAVVMASFIDVFMECTRKNWGPAGHEGSQSQEYDDYQLLIDATQKVINKAKAEYED